MESEQELKITRILFLKKFTEEIIYNLAKKQKTKLNIETEKIRKRFLLKDEEHPEGFKRIIHHKILHPLKYPKNYTEENKKQFIEKPNIKKIDENEVPSPKDIDLSKIEILQSIKPEYKPKPEGFVLGKLESLLQDNLIQTIECPGPGKNILIKKFDRINVTKIVLSQEEINKIINEFSDKSKIPLLGGILKAAVGNMLISAVTSDFAGSRFIINKIRPSVNIKQDY